jgi:hypothetical protein
MNYRTWVHDKVKNTPSLAALHDGRVHQTLEAIGGTPPDERPFVLLRFGEQQPELPVALSQTVTAWVYDEPGSYLVIDEIIAAMHEALEIQIVDPDGVACVWQGDSRDLADDEWGSIFRTSTYRMVGRR